MDLESPSKKLYERSRPPAALSSAWEMSPRSLHRKNSQLCEHSTDCIAEKWEETREVSDEGCILVCVRVVIVVKRQSEEKQEQR
ncbi:hypothetical protein ALC57_15034 [Trachymyrmex cornetzi]|uniref:Uncharacterized protein n=1 Tax=Trachymyrmex cornetzi TaxID=471704 RepID=A0A195DIT5_9HYME|nr:hypothetical protein ALC57_15034 [Trachymyrmex cornetzi]